VRINFFPENFQFDVRRRLGLDDLRSLEKLEPAIVLNLLNRIAGIDGMEMIRMRLLLDSKSMIAMLVNTLYGPVPSGSPASYRLFHPESQPGVVMNSHFSTKRLAS
jgi:hypothetical protein